MLGVEFTGTTSKISLVDIAKKARSPHQGLEKIENISGEKEDCPNSNALLDAIKAPLVYL